MKTLLTFFLTVFITGLSFAQTDKNLTKEKWKPKQEKLLYGHPVLRIEGKNDKIGITNVAYQTLSEFTADFENLALKQNWSKEQKKEETEALQKPAPGGVVHFYLTRLGMKSANTNLFAIQVKDSTNTEILNKDFDADIPEPPLNGSDYWSNYVWLPLPKEVKGKIYVDVIDKTEGKNAKFSFSVKL